MAEQAQGVPVRSPATEPRWWVRHRIRLLAALAAAVLLALGLGVWFAVTAVQAHSSLSAARDHLALARDALSDGDNVLAQAEVDRAAAETANARSATSALPWDTGAPIPYLGRPLETTREVADVADDLVQQVLRPALKASDAVAPERLRPSGERVDLGALVAAREPLSEASTAAAKIEDRADGIESGGYIGPVDEARKDLQREVSELNDLLQLGNQAATLLPPMLGADGPRTYFLAFQTNAEARGTAGLIGGYGLLSADQGRLSFDTLSTNRDLKLAVPPGIDLGPDYAAQYAGYSSTTLWLNANSSPHFPYAGQIWKSLWERQGGQIDGVLGIDPVALSYILRAVGPITLADGEEINADNVVRITESDAYVRFAGDTDARKDYLESIASAVADQILGGGGSTTEVLRALRIATNEGRIAAWSAVPAEQELLAGTNLGHVVPETRAPYANVVVLNGGESKLDYYLGRKLEYVAGDCSEPRRRSRISVDFTNGAPSTPLPEYVAPRTDLNPEGRSNVNRTLVSLYATSGAELTGASVDGRAVPVRTGAELGHPVYTVTLFIPPGATQRVVFDLIEPTSPGEAIVPVQPLVTPMTVTTDVPACGE